MATFDIATLKTITILFIEDEEKTREQEIKVYEKLFKKVFAAKDGLEALSILKENKDIIDIVVTDINMPNMDGFEFIQELNKISTIPVIVTSAYNDPEYLKKAISLGVKEYIIKPITINKIVQYIEKNVNEYRLNKKTKDVTKVLIEKSKNYEKELKTFINDHKKCLQDLEIYKSIVDKYVPTIVIDKQGNIIEYSNKLIRLLKYEKDELLGKNIEILRDKNCNNVTFQKLMLEAIYKKAAITTTYKLKTKDDKIIDFEIYLTLSYDENQLVDRYTLYLDPKI